MLNDERLKQSDLAHAGSSAAQTSLLLDIKARLEGAYSLLQAAASATKALGSSIDLYAKLEPRTLQSIDRLLQGLF